jgi:Family of unknown function (DUF6088)
MIVDRTARQTCLGRRASPGQIRLLVFWGRHYGRERRVRDLQALRKTSIFFLNQPDRLNMQTKRDQIVARIERLGEGKAFSAKDFLDVASRTMIDVTLANLALDGKIRRVRRGLYDVPKVNPSLGGRLSPDIDEAARAIARRQRWKIVPAGAWAANLLGLSTQVPAKIIYLTDGPNNEVAIGRRSIHFKHARPKAMAGLEGKFALVVQALRHVGKEGAGPREIETLRAALSPMEKRKLVKDTRFGVDWIYEVAKRIAEKTA